MTYVLKRRDPGQHGYYVALPGSPKSYTRTLDRAQRFDSRDAAKASACGNEVLA